MELYEFYSDTGLSREDIKWLFEPTKKEQFSILSKAKDAIVNKALKPVSDFTKNSTNMLTNVFTSVVNQIKSAAINMSNKIVNSTKKSKNDVKKYSKSLVDGIMKVIKPVINFIINTAKNFSQNIKWIVLLLGVILICFTFGRIKSFFKWIL